MTEPSNHALLTRTVLAFAAGTSLLPALAHAQCPATFTVSPAWTVGSPYSVSVGDFNNDGRLDFAVANFSGANATVRLANAFSPNDFLSPVGYPLQLEPRGSVAGDFNGDGRSDLAVVYGGGGGANARVAVMISNADGTFQTPALYQAPSAMRDLVLADINGDGLRDILVTSAFGSVTALRANANGTFQEGVVIASGLELQALTVADLNGDGTLDLATTRYVDPPQIRVSLGVPGSGGMSYGAFSPYVVPGNFGPWGIASGDFNGDGRSDVVATHRVNGSVGVLLSNADGSLTPMPVAGASTWPQDVAVADFNGDGRLDAAVGNWGAANISVLLGNGAGNLAARSNFSVGTNPNSLRIADMNNDGKPDIVVANQASGNVQILYNTTPVTLFALQPLDQRVCPGGTSSATFVARGTTTQAGGITGYHWEWLNGGVWQQLAVGTVAGLGTVSFAGGTNGDPTSLFVANVQGNAGDLVTKVRSVVTNACGSLASNAAELRINRPCGGADVGATGGVYTGCGDGVLDNNDFVVYIDLFFNGNAIADLGSQGGVPGADGQFNNNDFVVFIDLFFGGCP